MPILGTINSRTSLGTIREMVESDFDLVIDNSTARAIRNAYRHGTLLWDANKLITTDSSSIRIVRATDGRVESNV